MREVTPKLPQTHPLTELPRVSNEPPLKKEEPEPPMHISVLTSKRLGLLLSAAAVVAASTLQTAPAAAAASDPLPDPNVACASLTVANLQAVIDSLNADINGPATQDINSVPPGGTLYVAQYEHDDLVNARNMLVTFRDTVFVGSLLPGQSFLLNQSASFGLHDTVMTALDQVQLAEHYAIESAAYNRTLPPRYSYLAMVQLTPALVKLGADAGACDISLYPPKA
jgi:hypothetical protein